MTYEQIINRRSIRRYLQKDVPKEILLRCVDAARLSPSGGNMQPLKYIIVNDPSLLKPMFDSLLWYGFLPDFQPNEDEIPRAYIVILLNKTLRKSSGYDGGIAAMSISMVATDEGLGSCMLGGANKKEIREILEVPDDHDILLAVALGYTEEAPVIEEIQYNNVKYWLDENKVLNVPKRRLEDIMTWNRFEEG